MRAVFANHGVIGQPLRRQRWIDQQGRSSHSNRFDAFIIPGIPLADRSLTVVPKSIQVGAPVTYSYGHPDSLSLELYVSFSSSVLTRLIAYDQKMQIIDPVSALAGYSRCIKDVPDSLPLGAKTALNKLSTAVTALDSLRNKRAEKPQPTPPVSDDQLRAALRAVEDEITGSPYVFPQVDSDLDEFEVVDEYASYEEAVDFAIESVVSVRREFRLVNSEVFVHRKEFEAVITAYLYARRLMVGLDAVPEHVQSACDAAQSAIELFEKPDAFDVKLFSEKVGLLVAALRRFPTDKYEYSSYGLFTALLKAVDGLSVKVVPGFAMEESDSDFSEEELVEGRDEEDSGQEVDEDELEDRATEDDGSTRTVDLTTSAPRNSDVVTETHLPVLASDTIPSSDVVDQTHRVDESEVVSSVEVPAIVLDRAGPRLVYSDESESESDEEPISPVLQAPTKQTAVAQGGQTGSSLLNMRTSALQSDMSRATQDLLRRRETHQKQPTPSQKKPIPSQKKPIPSQAKTTPSLHRPLKSNPPPKTFSFFGLIESFCSVITCGNKSGYEA